MKTKQAKEESDKSVEDESTAEPKTRARKKATDNNDEDKNKNNQDEPKSSKDTKRNKSKVIIKRRPLGKRKALRNKRVIMSKEKLKNAIKQGGKRGRRPVDKQGLTSAVKDEKAAPIPMIPASEIKKEPVDETSPSSRSSSPRTAGRRQRLSSDMIMMKTVLGDSPGNLVLGPRTSPYSMRSERSNSPSQLEGKNLRSSKPRKVKANLLNEVVIKEQKKRTRLLSDSKLNESEGADECKKFKRGRSCSRDEMSKCSDDSESYTSFNDTATEADAKELNKKLDKSKTELDVDIENSVQISTMEKVPSPFDPIVMSKIDSESSSVLNDRSKRSLSLKRSTSLDSDNNNGVNRLELQSLHASLDLGDTADILLKTEKKDLLNARSSILTSMSKTFNSKEVSKNMRKVRRGRKAAAAPRAPSKAPAAPSRKTSTTLSTDLLDDKLETLDSLSKEINDLITNLDQSDQDNMDVNASEPELADGVDKVDAEVKNGNPTLDTPTKQAAKYAVSKPLCDNNIILATAEATGKEDSLEVDGAPAKVDDSENIRLHCEDDSCDNNAEEPKTDITYKCNVVSIDKLMGRLKELEECDKRRQRQESGSKASDPKQVMVSNDVVLIGKPGADMKTLKDIQGTVWSPEKPIEKENVLSCFENNSAISIVKREQVRKSIDVDLPNSISLIKRNSISRKASTGSNNSKESADAIAIFEKSLGKDVTLTEIRKSVDKSVSNTNVDIHQLATLHPNTQSPNIAGVVLDSKQISITPRTPEHKPETMKDIPRLPTSRKSSESAIDADMATIEKIKSPLEGSIVLPVVAAKSSEVQPMEVEPVVPSVDEVKTMPELPTSESSAAVLDTESKAEKIVEDTEKVLEQTVPSTDTDEANTTSTSPVSEVSKPSTEVPESETDDSAQSMLEKTESAKAADTEQMDAQPGFSGAFVESPETQRCKESILRTLGLLTHKAANEAKIEKLKEKERIYSGLIQNKNKGSKSGSGDYTGTLKTVIKLNRSAGEREKKKHRSSLKMTFQKSKNRSGKPVQEQGEAPNEDEYYTIERRETGAGPATDGAQRKSHSNRLNNHEQEAVPEPAAATERVYLLVPEKASSFSIHPGRLCMDQCFYCGGKFGLFDTPCHIAQMKSTERQKKVLDNEEKLTIDSCLCDACYRHVDRRANCPSYRKRSLKQPSSVPVQSDSLQQPTPPTDKPLSPTMDDESEEEAPPPAVASGRPAICHTEGCANLADHSIRRKWLIKMRTSVNKVLKLEGDYPGLHTIPLCGDHYRVLAPIMACQLCRCRITKHHNVQFINHGYLELNPLLKEAGIPVEFTERPILCKLCRYYCSLLQRPNTNEMHARAYRRRLLQVHNIDVPDEPHMDIDESVVEDELSMIKQRKKAKAKSKLRKSTELEKSGDSGGSPEKMDIDEPRSQEETNTHQESLEEDIESLISSNRILVPGANSQTNAEPEPALHVDKQTELQYLLQKQNNPAQFLQHKPRPKQGVNRSAERTARRLQQQLKHVISQRVPPVEVATTSTSSSATTSAAATVAPAPVASIGEECTIEQVPNKKRPDMNTLKNKWQQSESFTQVKKNLSELSKKFVPAENSRTKYANPVRRLETNPSISVRELFPGEEELGLQCGVEWGAVRGVTPEGWERCHSTIQYDADTRKLWHELQRPYGNQSSFLRHLVILEKYFRSGDLVLAAGASAGAAMYSDSVQNRLRAFDNVEPPAPAIAAASPAASAPAVPAAVSLIDYRKQRPSLNGKSLLKSQQPPAGTSETPTDAKKSPMPPPATIKIKPKTDARPKKSLPPELIAITTSPNPQGRKSGMQNVLHNIQQLVKGVTASDPTEVAAAPLPPPRPDAPKDKEPPKQDAPKKQKAPSKPWRPMLMPITPENLARIEKEPLQVAVDGRKLQSLVQVMSSGKKYHITLQDYNKMCVMRREKLQQMQDDGKKPSPEKEGASPPAAAVTPTVGNGAAVRASPAAASSTPKVNLATLGQMGTAATILKSVGLKNITIAPIPTKPATVTSLSPAAPLGTKLPRLGSGVTISSEPPSLPRIPKSLTVIPQGVPDAPRI